MAPPQIVVVDTNCYVRLLHSPVRPLLGQVVAEYKLMTTADLAAESLATSGLGGRQAWLAAPEIRAELAAATLRFREPKASRLLAEALGFRQSANALLRGECRARGIVARSVSMADARAWAAATLVEGVLATDEWPLRFAASRIDMDDAGNKLAVASTIDTMYLLERSGRLASAQRVEMMRSWKLSGEALHREADADYRRLFQADPPDAQAAISHKA